MKSCFMWPSISPRSGSWLPLHPPFLPPVLVPTEFQPHWSPSVLQTQKRDPASGLWTSHLLSRALVCKLLIRYCLLSEAPSGLFPQAAGSPWLFCHLTERCLLAHCPINLGLPSGRQNLGGSLSSLWLHQLQLEWGLAFNTYLLNGWMNE